jgi:hypothetical protein
VDGLPDFAVEFFEVSAWLSNHAAYKIGLRRTMNYFREMEETKVKKEIEHLDITSNVSII